MIKILKFITTFILCVLISVLVGAYWAYSQLNVPELDINKLPQTTLIYDSHNNLVAELHGAQNRIIVEQINNKNIKNAVISIEDERFWQNKYGFDFKRIASAFLTNLKQRKIVEGGSGIQQQLVKNFYLSQERTIKRKIIEALYTLKLNQYSKEQILNAYLNTVYFGEGAYGVEAAANVYFGKHVQQLTLSESAALAGIINNPTVYDPYKNMNKCIERRNIVLQKMFEQGYISGQQYQEAVNEKLNLSRLDLVDYPHKYYIDFVVDELIKEFGENKVFAGGLRVYTAMNPAIQQVAENQFLQPYNFPNSNIQAACIIEDSNNKILAIVGGRDFPKQNRCLNRAYQVKRQPGSAIKPLTVYAAALESGGNEYSIVNDSPVTFGNYTPHNYESDYWGWITYKEALTYSRNVPAVKIANEIGIKNCIQQGEKFGLTFTNTDYYLPAVSLGGLTYGETPLVMCNAYTTILKNGVYMKPTVIIEVTDSQGNIIYKPDNKPTQAISEQTASQLKDMLLNVVESGTGTNAKIPGMNVYGKTGTTSNSKDAWFCGFTDKYACAVWMGYDDGKSMGNIVGGTYPARLWRNIMSCI
ncbi:transglycosylase domain-containing protein [Thermoanaerobacterium thermosaccharolyticum]|uniref:transglycosylase domain-containing protein n=1 Tax=Thermoanaerobacterium thermosaccharolyticum TaxID=1517 RepID=UPI001782C094|nr:PBP1A family penicillin-binding protein [Thermoanaerobacterium thermosaccharolyticum]MBE0069831.1 PBP1A family penicillin-binding protein [Thermoanaerobacterium thermosaccharolyticum]MBE0227505.1 PBP1A family penicillin-binding protein [Thermoanaerobacterium thermosaccharolyticum]